MRLKTETYEPSDFAWLVPKRGYRWAALPPVSVDRGIEEHKRLRVLTDELTTAQYVESRRYAPLREESGLFRILALETEISEDGILGFANKYGHLGEPVSIPVLTEASMVGSGETLDSWSRETLELRHLVELWDMVCSGDTEEIARRIQWNEDPGVEYDSDPGQPRGAKLPPLTARNRVTIAGKHTRQEMLQELLQRFPPRDVIAPARCLLQLLINKNLNRLQTNARLLWDSGWTRLRLHIVPGSLIGCLWLQFAMAVSSEKRYRQCDDCARWYEAGGNRTARSDKRFCDGTCKSNAHRKKKDKAREMAARHVSLPEIAQKLDTRTVNVRRWLKGR